MSDAREEQLSALRAANIERQDAWKVGGDLGPVGGLFRATELGGEAGEVLNVVKKLEREARGWRGSRATVDDLAQELGDVVICADLLAAEYDIDLWAAVVAKFNATSEKVGLPTRLAAGYAKPSPAAEAGLDDVERAAKALGAWDYSQSRVDSDWPFVTADAYRSKARAVIAALSTRPAGESAGVAEALTAKGEFRRIGWETVTDEDGATERFFTGDFDFSEPPNWPVKVAWGLPVQITLTPLPPEDAALSTRPAGESAGVAEALEQAVDAMEFYMLPSAMDGGIGECSALINTKAALEKAKAALAARASRP